MTHSKQQRSLAETRFLASLEGEDQFCPDCMDYFNERPLPKEWHFNLLVEIEPNDCNIEQWPVDEEKLLWVSAVQLAGRHVSIVLLCLRA